MTPTAKVGSSGPEQLKRKNEQNGRERKRKDHAEGNTAHTPAHKKQRIGSPLDIKPQRQGLDYHPADSPISTPSPSSPFVVQRTSLYLSLYPISQAKPLEALCAEHLSAQILSYYAPLHGVLLSYSNSTLSNTGAASTTAQNGPVYAKSIDEYAVSYAWVTADFLMFRPSRGTQMEGHVTLQNENHLSLLCYNHFNASIERKHLPRSWRWSGAASGGKRKHSRDEKVAIADSDKNAGTFVRPDGSTVSGTIKFRVMDFEGGGNFGTSKAEGYLLIQGTLLGEDEEKSLWRLEEAEQANKHAVVESLASRVRVYSVS